MAMTRVKHLFLFSSAVAFAFSMGYSLLAVLLSIGSPKAPAPVLPGEDDLLGDRPRLLLGRDNAFTVAIFSDLHFGEDEHSWGPEQDANSTRVMRAVLAAESAESAAAALRGPDLVVVNGDLITGENTFRDNSTAYLDLVVAPMVERGVPWASTYGNHDSKFNLSRQMLYNAERLYALSYTQRMRPSLPGITNYYLLVRRPASTDAGVGVGAPALVLWFFDSRGGTSYQNGPARDGDAGGGVVEDDIPNFVAPETAAWFRSASAGIRAEHGVLPSLAFVHIPPHVFLAAQRAGIDASRYPGINDDEPLTFQGEAGGEGDGEEDEDAAFVAALAAEEGLHSIYVGHDHGNAWCANWASPLGERKRIRAHRRKSSSSSSSSSHDGDGDGSDHGRSGPFLCFSKHTGYGGYGEWERGARVVQLRFPDATANASRLLAGGNMEVETWVRMEGGEVVSRVVLNETYGEDRYPVTTRGTRGSRRRPM